MARRLIRLYPVYLLAGLVCLPYVLFLREQGGAGGYGALPYFVNLLLIPFPPDRAPADVMFPLNFVAWSILVEIGLSLVLATNPATFASRKRVSLLMARLAPLLVLCAVRAGHLNLGPDASGFAAGIVRGLFSFSAGVLIALFGRDGVVLRAAPSFALIATILAAMMMVDLSGPARIVYDLVAVILVFPAMTVAASCCRIEGIEKRVALTLGAASYTIYILHIFCKCRWRPMRRSCAISRRSRLPLCSDWPLPVPPSGWRWRWTSISTDRCGVG